MICNTYELMLLNINVVGVMSNIIILDMSDRSRTVSEIDEMTVDDSEGEGMCNHIPDR